MELLVFGTNHAVAPAAVRDRLALDTTEAERLLEAVCSGNGVEAAAVSEAVVLSTCTRTEVFAWTQRPPEAAEIVRGALRAVKGGEVLPEEQHTFLLTGREGAGHLFRVAAGLDSLMIGEPQVLGQVREAFAVAESSGTVEPHLSRLFQAAVRAGKRARSETDIGKGAASVAFAAVGLAANILTDLTRHSVLVVGAGRTGAQAARHFSARRPAQLTVVNRTPDRARDLAVELGAVARPFEELAEALAEASVVVTATAAPRPVIATDVLRAVMETRRGRPLVVVDIANPRDVEPGAAMIPDVFLHDLDSMGDIVEENLIRRAEQVPHVERIVEEELDRFLDWYDTLEVLPVLKSLRERFHRIAAEEVLRHRSSFDEAGRAGLEQYTRSLVAKLLHHPTRQLRELDLSTPEGLSRLAAVKELFRLEPDESSSAGVEDGQTDVA